MAKKSSTHVQRMDRCELTNSSSATIHEWGTQLNRCPEADRTLDWHLARADLDLVLAERAVRTSRRRRMLMVTTLIAALATGGIVYLATRQQYHCERLAWRLQMISWQRHGRCCSSSVRDLDILDLLHAQIDDAQCLATNATLEQVDWGRLKKAKRGYGLERNLTWPVALQILSNTLPAKLLADLDVLRENAEVHCFHCDGHWQPRWRGTTIHGDSARVGVMRLPRRFLR